MEFFRRKEVDKYFRNSCLTELHLQRAAFNGEMSLLQLFQ